ncbi:MAG: hypothetical protein EP330_17770 [Deltaproteobacteria bacterium]|nr:MAG: hypothetical protein EP330_17770 [Deltaproteobacteria bacterium]
MQGELDAEYPNLDITLFGVNEVGQESANELAYTDVDIGLLQDTVGVDAWGSWQVTWRDIVILDGANEVVSVHNLTTFNLADTANYDQLKSELVTAAQGL